MSASSFPPSVPRKEFLQSQRAILKDILQAYLDYQKRFGDIFGIRILSRDFYVATSHEYFTHILFKNNRNYQKDRPSHIVGDVIGHGILTSEGEYWLRQRRLIQPAFHKKQIENLSMLMVKETEKIVEEVGKTREPVDLMQLMTSLTLKVVSRTLFGKGIDEDGFDMVNEVLTDLLDLMVAKIRNPFALIKWRITGKMGFYENQRSRIDQLIFDMVDERRAEGIGNEDLMDMLLSARDADTGEPLTQEELRQELITLFLAGHETSANGLTYAFMLLEQHPEVMEKVLTEIDQVLGDGDISFEKLRSFTYLKQVIDETLRLFPPAWVIGREALQPDQIGDLKLETGDNIALFIYGLHHNEKYWPDPEKFDPDRFSEVNKKDRPNHAYLPFGGGPRLCVGHQFAIVEMQIALIMLLRKYKLTRTNPGEPLDLIASVTLRPKTPILMKFEERESVNQMMV